MSEIKIIKCDPGLLQMPVILRRWGGIYLRLPPDLQREIAGGCNCPYCDRHPELKPTWDTLVVAVEDAKNPGAYFSNNWTWTIHMPEPQIFTEGWLVPELRSKQP